MYNVSAEFLTAIRSPYREIKAKLVLGDLTIFTEDIKSIKTDICATSSTDFSIGDTPAAGVEITLNNMSGLYNNTVFKDNKLKVYIGVKSGQDVLYCPLGIFNIDYSSRPGATIELKGLDDMILLDKPYTRGITYPATIANVLEDACAQCNVNSYTIFTNSNLTLTESPNLEELTCREVVAKIAECAGGFASINRDGVLVIKSYDGVALESLTKNNYFDLKPSDADFAAINKLILRHDTGSVEVGAGDSAFVIKDNPFLVRVTTEHARAIYNVLSAISYEGFSCDWQGNPALEVGDVVAFTGHDDTVHQGIVASLKFDFDGGLSSTVEAYADSNTNRETSTKGAIERRVEALEKRPAGDVNVEVVEQITTTTEVSHINNCWTRNLNVEYLETNFSALDVRQPYTQYRNYIRIYDNVIEFHVSEMSQNETEYLKTVDNQDVYWTAINDHEQAYKFFTLTSPLERYQDLTESEVNAFRVQVRKTIKDDIKKKEVITAVDDNYAPIEVLGIGNGTQANQEYQFLEGINLMQNQAVVLKDARGYLIEYYKSNGGKAWLRIGDNGIEMSHSALKSIDFYTDGFKVNGNCKFKWVPNGLLKDDGELIRITELNQNINMEDED